MKAILLLVVLLGSSAFCQEKSIPDKMLDDLLISLDDGAAFFTSPLRMDKQDAEHFALFAASTAVFAGSDKSARNLVQEIKRSEMLGDVMTIGRRYGEVRTAIIIPSVVYAGGLVSGNDDIRITGRQIFQALLYSGIVTQSLKWIVGRSRPSVSNDPYKAKLFNFSEPRSDDNFSMPSGDATAAFAISSVLSERIDNIFASIGLYGLAATTAISRLYYNRHWASDVFVGAVIGTAAGIFVTNRDEADSRDRSSLEFDVSPAGMRLAYRF